MTAQLSPTPVFKAFANDGTPLAYGKLTSYAAGTTTPQATYIDSTQTTQNTNPIILNARGECALWLNPGLSYKLSLTDANGNLIPGYPVDNIQGIVSGSGLGTLLPATNNTYFLGSPSLSWADLYLGPSDISVLTTLTNDSSAITALQLGLNDADQIETVTTSLQAGTAVTMAVFGDSSMWGATANNTSIQVATPPPLQLQGALNNFFGNSACTVLNEAISGTCLNQMLLGTDGSGLTYLQRISTGGAAAACPIIWCDHCANDASPASGVSTTPAVYRSNLIKLIQQTRGQGKTLILITPHPFLTVGSLGGAAQVEAIGIFKEIMLEIAGQHGVKVVDNYKYLSMLMGTLNTLPGSQANANLPLTILPDGAHGLQPTYTYTGNNLCEGILSGFAPIIYAGESIGATRQNTLATGLIFGASTSSTQSAAAATGNSGSQSMRTVFRTDIPGLDISVLHNILSVGSPSITVNLDGVQAGAFTPWAQTVSGFSTTFLQDIETTLFHNIPPGFHQLTMTCATGSAITLNGIRARPTDRPIQLGYNVTDLSQRQLISPKMVMNPGATGNQITMTNYVTSRFCENLELEWTGQMTKNSGVGVFGQSGTLGGAPTVERLLTFALNSSGFATFTECTGPNAYTVTVLDAVDHSAASHTYRGIVTAANPGTAQMFVDDVSVGTVTLTLCYYGGWFGVWKNLNTDTLTLTNISRVWHY